MTTSTSTQKLPSRRFWLRQIHNVSRMIALCRDTFLSWQGSGRSMYATPSTQKAPPQKPSETEHPRMGSNHHYLDLFRFSSRMALMPHNSIQFCWQSESHSAQAPILLSDLGDGGRVNRLCRSVRARKLCISSRAVWLNWRCLHCRFVDSALARPLAQFFVLLLAVNVIWWTEIRVSKIDPLCLYWCERRARSVGWRGEGVSNLAQKIELMFIFHYCGFVPKLTASSVA